VVASAALLPVPSPAGDLPAPRRPLITGLSHVALWVANLDRSRAFYKGYLGFDEPYTLPAKDGSVLLTWIKINDRQTLELFPVSEATPRNGDSLYHVAFETDNAQGMLDYLASRDVRGPGGRPLPATAPAGRIGNLNYFTEDPDGHIIEFVQYLPGGWTLAHKGRYLPETRISGRMSHAGIVVADLGASLRFYRDILGFTETWRGSSDGRTLSWVNLRVPDGTDYLELMLVGAAPDTDRLHILHHVCLEVPSVAAAEATLRGRILPEGCKTPTPARTGINRKRQVNVYDPDGTRVEIMEAATVDGSPAPSSAAPPPGPAAAVAR
jgi:lactoylglutathione lyase